MPRPNSPIASALGLQPAEVQRSLESARAQLLAALEERGAAFQAFLVHLFAEREIIVRLNPRTSARADEMIELVLDMERAKLFDPATAEALL